MDSQNKIKKKETFGEKTSNEQSLDPGLITSHNVAAVTGKQEMGIASA